jgi:23S rRNA G2069 N7-methylase RlmK/C1962 C5-methylase RlmI
MLGNRVRKNFRKLKPSFDRRRIEAFRLYDRDIPEVRAVVDWYAGHAVLGEYERAQTSDEAYRDSLAQAVASALEIAPDHVHVKARRTRPAEGARYQRLARTERRLEVREGDLRFWVNLDDYIDTGLFPDHRETRQLVRAESAGSRFLNLFAYTGSFTCAAALGGASSTTTVDVSASYLRWTHDNLQLNGFAADVDGIADSRHELVREDARAFLARAAREGRRYALCVLDPPSFSTRESGSFDVQRDHRSLIEEALRVLTPGGVLWFSTNHQRFVPDLAGLPAASVTDATSRTVPADYRNRQAHRSFRIVGR